MRSRHPPNASQAHTAEAECLPQLPSEPGSSGPRHGRTTHHHSCITRSELTSQNGGFPAFRRSTSGRTPAQGSISRPPTQHPNCLHLDLREDQLLPAPRRREEDEDESVVISRYTKNLNHALPHKSCCTHFIPFPPPNSSHHWQQRHRVVTVEEEVGLATWILVSFVWLFRLLRLLDLPGPAPPTAKLPPSPSEMIPATVEQRRGNNIRNRNNKNKKAPSVKALPALHTPPAAI